MTIMQRKSLVEVGQRKIAYWKMKSCRLASSVAISISAESKYNNISPPLFNEDFLFRITGGSSLFVQLLQSNVIANEDARRLLEGEFRIFSKTITVSPGGLDWSKDYFSGFSYPLKPYTSLPIIEDQGVEIVVPWELSKLQFIPTLVCAYRTTGERRFVDFFVNLLEDWSIKNPYLYGVNWMCGLDIGIRALNIGIGLAFFRDQIPADKLLNFQKLLWAHILYLMERDVDQSKIVNNNHLLISCISLFCLLHWFCEDELIRDMKKKMLLVINREIVRQFKSDGGNFESATAYHIYLLEAIYFMLSVTDCNEDANNRHGDVQSLSSESLGRIHKATSIVSEWMQTWGKMPHLGDSSDARVMIYREYFSWSPCDANFILDWAALLFGNNFPQCAEIGKYALYAESGLGIYKGKCFSVIVAALQVDSSSGGHNHCDKGSVLLSIRNSPVFVDPGTYCYISELKKRNSFKSTKYHNVVVVDGQEQANVDWLRTFAAPEIICEIKASENINGTVVFHTVHSGYERIDDLGVLERHVRCRPTELSILDKVKGKGEHQIEIFFHLAPELYATVQHDFIEIYKEEKLLCTVKPQRGWGVKLEDYFYSKEFCKIEPSKRIIIFTRSTLPLEVVTKIKVTSYE